MIPVEWLPQYTYQDYKSWEGDWELIEGIPYSLLPSPKRKHQATSRNFVLLATDALKEASVPCNCEVFYELDWIVNDTTVVRPDAMIVCGKFEDDFLRFPPTVVVEVTSRRTQMADRNVKFKLYESEGVPYYIIADPDRETTDIFQLKEGRYQQMASAVFALQNGCVLQLDVTMLWR